MGAGTGLSAVSERVVSGMVSREERRRKSTRQYKRMLHSPRWSVARAIPAQNRLSMTNNPIGPSSKLLLIRLFQQDTSGSLGCRAPSPVSEDLARIPVAVFQRRGLPTIFGRVPLVGGLRVSPMRDRRAYELVKLRRWQCAGCRHQVSLTAGTILHNTKTPLTVWFWAAYLMTTDKRGVSALLLQRQLALRRYETAWMMLHKFRRAMVNVAREPLQGEVEVDDTWVGGPQAGLRGSRQLKGRKAALVIVAVEKRGRSTG